MQNLYPSIYVQIKLIALEYVEMTLDTLYDFEQKYYGKC